MNPNDEFFSEQWALAHLDVPAAWDCLGPNPSDVIVAVVDTGIDDNHEDLQPCLLGSLTTVDILRDDDDHGTQVAGTIGSVTGNGKGIAGAAEVKILSVKFCSQQVIPDPDMGAQAIRDAADFLPTDTRPRVINLSWDVSYSSPALHSAITYAGVRGALVVVAAGNESLDIDRHPNWPANYGNMSHVVTVMATDKNDERASFSNFGATTVHIGAPGVDILSTVPYFGPRIDGGTYVVGYRGYFGTSAAAAYVSGLAALIRAKYPSLTAPQVKNHLLASAKLVPGLSGLCVTGGIVNYEQAICGPAPSST
jgi:subtilisin family serine protease